MRNHSKKLAKLPDELLPEYHFDYSQSRPNRFARLFEKDSVAVVLDPDVAAVFNTSKSVNRLLRSIIAALPKEAKPRRATHHKEAGRPSKRAVQA